MLYSVKVVSRNDNTMLNMCDSELLGKTISDGKIVMKINKNYYSLKLGIGSQQSVKLIDNVPFLIIIKM